MSSEGNEPAPLQEGNHWRQVIDENLGKVLASSFRQQILWIFNERVASPSEIADELGETLNRVCHHVAVLHAAGCIKPIDKKVVGNRIQNFYQATARAYIGGMEWKKVPPTVQAGMRATLLANIIEDSVEVVGAEAYDASPAHMSWTTMILDAQGNEEVIQLLDQALQGIIAIQESTKERLVEEGSPGTPYTVTVMGYPTLGGEKHVSPPIEAEELDVAVQSSRSGKDEATGKSGSEKQKSPPEAGNNRGKKGA